MYIRRRSWVIEADAVSFVSTLHDLSIDCCVTSPPYKDKDGFSLLLMNDLARALFPKMKNNTMVFLNFGHLAGQKGRPFTVADCFVRNGFQWIDTIVWMKKQFSPLKGDTRLNNLSEFIFMLAKGTPRLNRLAIGVPYKDKSNIGRYSERDLRCRGNVWEIGYETIQSRSQKLHPDRFPVELPTLCLKLVGGQVGKRKVVLDPFMGSGTTAVAAKQLGWDYCGCDLSADYVETAKRRLREL